MLAGDDIDTHCIGPRWCDRGTHFFGQHAHCLETMLQRSPWVKAIQAVPDAYVPVIKLEVTGGMEIDLTYAQLPFSDVPKELDLQVWLQWSECACTHLVDTAAGGMITQPMPCSDGC